MKILFIGGTGTISAAISRLLLRSGHDLYLLNRGKRNDVLPEGAHYLLADIEDEDKAAGLIKDLDFDCVVDFIAFVPEQLQRDYRLFNEKTKQFIFISSASVYQKPLSEYRITEATPLANPYWQYSRNKIECEDYLMKLYREKGFPVTIVRPSYTYDERKVPLAVHGTQGTWSVVKRIADGKPVIIHGDGTALWTMTHNSDFAKGFVGLLGNIRALGEAVQITSDETLTWNQIYQCIAKAVNRPLKAVHVSSEFLAAAGPYNFYGGLLGDKAVSAVFDNTKLKRLVPGFVAIKRFDEGVKETIDYILDHPEYQQEDPEFDAWTDKIIETMQLAAKKIKFNENYEI
ncbi:MAG: SDR family oxidoreductase [Dysgonamonadaceae bacterium]|jgi:nucleoside-diphosphate-sugar epimerase|nr:SDR family oxidoreductase [Dysgonamonadaceae bacterium]